MSRPLGLMTSTRPDARRFLCDWCDTATLICSRCDRGQRYCSSYCAREARRRSLREAGARYQRTAAGRRNHARRQQEYLGRLKTKMTHQGSPEPAASVTVGPCVDKTSSSTSSRSSASSSPRRRRNPTCFVCGSRCEPWIRHEFLRRPRSNRSRKGGRHDSFLETGRDPTSLHD